MIVCRSPFVVEREKEERIIVHRENERKKEATERMRGKKKRRSSGENERKKNLEEREIIDKINSCYNNLIQEIQLLMYSSSSDLMSYYSLAKKI